MWERVHIRCMNGQHWVEEVSQSDSLGLGNETKKTVQGYMGAFDHLPPVLSELRARAG